MCVGGKLALFSKPATSDRVHILTLNLPLFVLFFLRFQQINVEDFICLATRRLRKNPFENIRF